MHAICVPVCLPSPDTHTRGHANRRHLFARHMPLHTLMFSYAVGRHSCMTANCRSKKYGRFSATHKLRCLNDEASCEEESALSFPSSTPTLSYLVAFSVLRRLETSGRSSPLLVRQPDTNSRFSSLVLKLRHKRHFPTETYLYAVGRRFSCMHGYKCPSPPS